MTAVLLEPHQDDAALFAAFTCYTHNPFVVTVLRSDVQERRGTGITHLQRVHENEGAMMILGCEWEQWAFSDAEPDWEGIGRCVADLGAAFDYCYAPAFEEGGHEHHNRIAEIADFWFPARVTHYMTYTNGRARSEGSQLVEPVTGAVAAKLQALACYESQINEWSTGHHFLQPLHEWYE